MAKDSIVHVIHRDTNVIWMPEIVGSRDNKERKGRLQLRHMRNAITAWSNRKTL